TTRRRAPRMQSAHAASGTGDAEDGVDGLNRRDREILGFERQWWKYAGAKEQAIRELFDMSATRYYQVLNALIDTPAALAADPMLVKRLRRVRARRQPHAGQVPRPVARQPPAPTVGTSTGYRGLRL